MTVKREAVIYRHGLNKMTKDKNTNRPGYAECSYCKTWRPVTDGKMKWHSQYLTRKNGYLPCPNPAGVVIVPVVENKPRAKRKPCTDIYLRENIRSLRDQEYTLGMMVRATGVDARKIRSILDLLPETD